MTELAGEKIDIISFDDDPAVFVGNALSPSTVVSVTVVDAKEQAARVVVPDYKLSLAIGKEGQNARLAARLTGWRIDIRSDAEAADAGGDGGPARSAPGGENQWPRSVRSRRRSARVSAAAGVRRRRSLCGRRRSPARRWRHRRPRCATPATGPRGVAAPGSRTAWTGASQGCVPPRAAAAERSGRRRGGTADIGVNRFARRHDQWPARPYPKGNDRWTG
ncbi:MAG: hypothetical protein QM775_32190 [Pirellulales bacterium]